MKTTSLVSSKDSISFDEGDYVLVRKSSVPANSSIIENDPTPNAPSSLKKIHASIADLAFAFDLRKFPFIGANKENISSTSSKRDELTEQNLTVNKTAQRMKMHPKMEAVAAMPNSDIDPFMKKLVEDFAKYSAGSMPERNILNPIVAN